MQNFGAGISFELGEITTSDQDYGCIKHLNQGGGQGFLPCPQAVCASGLGFPPGPPLPGGFDIYLFNLAGRIVDNDDNVILRAIE